MAFDDRGTYDAPEGAEGPGEGREQEFGRALDDVAAGSGPTSTHLGGLSHLLPAEVVRFREAWEPLSERQKLALLDALSDAEEASLRLDFNAIYHLGTQDASASVRQRAVESTVEDESTWLLERLLELLVRDDDPDVRAAAAVALQAFSQRAELGELTDDQAARVRQTLLETIHRPGERQDVRAEALATIGYFSDATVSRELGAAFHEEETRLYALRGMGHSADPTWVDTILEQLDDPDDAIRAAAAVALGEIGEERAVPALTDVVDDAALPVRLAAIGALGEIGGDEAREALVYALEDKNEAIREAAEAAIEALDFFEDPLAP